VCRSDIATSSERPADAGRSCPASRAMARTLLPPAPNTLTSPMSAAGNVFGTSRASMNFGVVMAPAKTWGTGSRAREVPVRPEAAVTRDRQVDDLGVSVDRASKPRPSDPCHSAGTSPPAHRGRGGSVVAARHGRHRFSSGRSTDPACAASGGEHDRALGQPVTGIGPL